ncbi:hypothetical protein CFIMG_004501RA [Ceratocystis fimbriata CBS 114723]|uniref:Biogenesis of lysosome-related organelles complex 1 subunit CNL1 n=1 Tax=Ceratocystis fimbriata CBS 114723 TaxID=1035309 RepID=A0A2C5WXS3_9PEZI|nr:hypothetical protein CFIMG_004501RA [Ceratocystis fimbriata CBS 114723]
MPRHSTVLEPDMVFSERQIDIIHQSQAYLESTQFSPSSPHSSRAASKGSSSQSQDLRLDTTSIMLLGQHFDAVMEHVKTQMGQLESQIAQSTLTQHNDATIAMVDADAEMGRLEGYMMRMDELETYFDEISSLRDIIKGNRQRIALLAQQLEETPEAESRAGSTDKRKTHKQGRSSKHGRTSPSSSSSSSSLSKHGAGTLSRHGTPSSSSPLKQASKKSSGKR